MYKNNMFVLISNIEINSVEKKKLKQYNLDL